MSKELVTVMGGLFDWEGHSGLHRQGSSGKLARATPAVHMGERASHAGLKAAHGISIV